MYCNSFGVTFHKINKFKCNRNCLTISKHVCWFLIRSLVIKTIDFISFLSTGLSIHLLYKVKCYILTVCSVTSTGSTVFTSNCFRREGYIHAKHKHTYNLLFYRLNVCVFIFIIAISQSVLQNILLQIEHK